MQWISQMQLAVMSRAKYYKKMYCMPKKFQEVSSVAKACSARIQPILVEYLKIS